MRRYDVTTETYTNFVAPGGPLESPWYLTFGKTDPATLAYKSKQGDAPSVGMPAGRSDFNSQISSLDPLLTGASGDQAPAQVDRLHALRRRSAP